MNLAKQENVALTNNNNNSNIFDISEACTPFKGVTGVVVE
jgi:hypothetical protein